MVFAHNRHANAQVQNGLMALSVSPRHEPISEPFDNGIAGPEKIGSIRLFECFNARICIVENAPGSQIRVMNAAISAKLRKNDGRHQIVAHIFYQLSGLLQIINGCEILSIGASKERYYVCGCKCVHFIF